VDLLFGFGRELLRFGASLAKLRSGDSSASTELFMWRLTLLLTSSTAAATSKASTSGPDKVGDRCSVDGGGGGAGDDSGDGDGGNGGSKLLRPKPNVCGDKLPRRKLLPEFERPHFGLALEEASKTARGHANALLDTSVALQVSFNPSGSTLRSSAVRQPEPSSSIA